VRRCKLQSHFCLFLTGLGWRAWANANKKLITTYYHSKWLWLVDFENLPKRSINFGFLFT
jgi:hypothetical protein